MTIFMATSKKRINISLSSDLEEALALLAKRDQVPEATKAIQLLRQAIELDEDEVWAKIAEERDTPNAVYISHEEMWHDL